MKKAPLIVLMATLMGAAAAPPANATDYIAGGIPVTQENPATWRLYPLPTNWTNTTHSLQLPAAGTYMVTYNASSFRSKGTRGDMTAIRLSSLTGGVSRSGRIAGIMNNTDQIAGNVTLTHVFTVTAPDTITVQALDLGSGDLQLDEAGFFYIKF